MDLLLSSTHWFTHWFYSLVLLSQVYSLTLLLLRNQRTLDNSKEREVERDNWPHFVLIFVRTFVLMLQRRGTDDGMQDKVNADE